jgi:hypothetical protein
VAVSIILGYATAGERPSRNPADGVNTSRREQQPPVSKVTRDLALQMLKRVKEDLKRHYYDPSFRGIDVEARFREIETGIREAASANQVGELLAEFCLQFDDSHTRFYPPDRSVRTEYGWRMSIVGDAPLITWVEKGSDAEQKGLATGDRVQLLNRYRPARENLWWLRYYFHAIRPQVQQRLTVAKPDGLQRVYDIRSRVSEVTMMQLQDWIAERVDDGRRGSLTDVTWTLDPGILVWRMPHFGEEREVHEATRRARESHALIVDMRGNGGGRVDTLKTLVGLTFDRPVRIGTEVTRTKRLPEEVKPARTPFTGRLIVLVDSDSASAAEVYARVVQIEKRGTVLGDRTAGAVMTSQFFPHEAGIGRFVLFGASITVADLIMSDGGRLEKAGVQPDELLLPTQHDLAQRRDPVLARAVALAGGALTPDAAGALLRTP